MIITVTMNPALDKTVDVSEFDYGGLNRIQHIEIDIGGKGINVSKTVKALGGETIVTGFIGGSAGEMINKTLRDSDIHTDFIQVDRETRTNLKVVDNHGTVTELNEAGPEVKPEQINALIDKIEDYANEEALFVLAGSVPPGVPKDIYGVITEKVHRKGAKVVLDADGELFLNALDKEPDIIKPNRVELEALFNIDYRATEKELIAMGRKLVDKKIDLVAISLGQMGALFLSKDRTIKCPGLTVDSHSTVGAGDAMVAALAYAVDKGLDVETYVSLSMATSAGAVTTIGTKPPTKEVVDQLMKQVEIIEL